MLLAVDIGNSNITLGVFRGEELRATWRIATDVYRLADEYAVLILNLMPRQGIEPSEVKESVICSVVPPLTPVFEELCCRYFGSNPLLVEAGIKTGMPILYDNPKEVGADRVAHGVAAFKKYGGPVIIVDFGTATVFDAISREGEYLGGAIAPGLAIAAEALFQRTSKLPRIELVPPSRAIGKNTVSSMQSGLMLGYVGLIEGLVGRFQKELGGGAKVVATGGLAKMMAKQTSIIDALDPDLVLVGLRMIYEMNRS